MKIIFLTKLKIIEENEITITKQSIFLFFDDSGEENEIIIVKYFYSLILNYHGDNFFGKIENNRRK